MLNIETHTNMKDSMKNQIGMVVSNVIENNNNSAFDLDFVSCAKSMLYAEDYKVYDFKFNELEDGEVVDTCTVQVEILNDSEFKYGRKVYSL